MIRFEQRASDDPRTERIFKKVIHPSQNAVKLVDRDGIPLRLPNSATFSRLQSSYVLSPRGVPTRRSNHSYSGQLSQGKMHPLITSLEPQEMVAFNPVQTYNLSSAGSARSYMPVNTPTTKKRVFGGSSRPNRSLGPASMAKSASTARSGKYLSSDESVGSEADLEQLNASPQSRRLEKEWSALSQCRALKRSSEIVSHRVDRMYFMTGNSMKLQQKYHVEDNDLKQLKELSQARAASRQSRTSSRIKGDIYRPNRSARSTQSGRSEGPSVNGTEDRRSSKGSRGDGVKENSDPVSNILVSQKALTPKPSSRKSPLQGWAADDSGPAKDTSVVNGFDQEKSLHDGDDVRIHDGDDVRVASADSNTGEQTDNVNTDKTMGDNPAEEALFQTDPAGDGEPGVNNDESVTDRKAKDLGDEIQGDSSGEGNDKRDESDDKLDSVQSDKENLQGVETQQAADGRDEDVTEN